MLKTFCSGTSAIGFGRSHRVVPLAPIVSISASSAGNHSGVGAAGASSTLPVWPHSVSRSAASSWLTASTAFGPSCASSIRSNVRRTDGSNGPWLCRSPSRSGGDNPTADSKRSQRRFQATASNGATGSEVGTVRSNGASMCDGVRSTGPTPRLHSCLHFRHWGLRNRPRAGIIGPTALAQDMLQCARFRL